MLISIEVVVIEIFGINVKIEMVLRFIYIICKDDKLVVIRYLNLVDF